MNKTILKIIALTTIFASLSSVAFAQSIENNNNIDLNLENNQGFSEVNDGNIENKNDILETLDNNNKSVQLILSDNESCYEVLENTKMPKSRSFLDSPVITVNQTAVEEIYKAATDENYYMLTEAGTYLPTQCIEVDLTDENNIEEVIEKYNLNDIRSNYLREAHKKYLENPNSSNKLTMYLPKELTNNMLNTRISPVTPGFFHYSINGYRLTDDIYVRNNMWSTNMKISGINSSGTAKNLRTLIVTGVSIYIPEISLINSEVTVFQNFTNTVTPNVVKQTYDDTVEVNLNYDIVDKITMIEKYGNYIYGIKTTRVDLRIIETSAYFYVSNSQHSGSMRRVKTTKYPNQTLKTPNYDSAAEYSIRFAGGMSSVMPKEEIYYKVAAWNYFAF